MGDSEIIVEMTFWRALVALGAFGLVVLVVIILSTSWVGGTPTSSRAEAVRVSGESSGQDFAFEVSFGLSRLPITRSVLLDLCPQGAPAGQQTYPECATQTGSATNAARPEVTSAGVVADLQRTDKQTQFPARQLAVEGANEGSTGLRITVAADPRQPERVDPGDL